MARLTPTAAAVDSTRHHRRGNSFIFSINKFFARLKRQASAGGSPKSSLAKPKQLLVKNRPFGRHDNNNGKKSSDSCGDQFESADDQLDFGDGGLWQRDILMGDKCQPLDFSGVIYYDSNGRQLSEVPMKSPRASPLPSYVYASSHKY